MLSCPEEYTVIITARDCSTYVGELVWSQLSWSRVLDDISECTVVVPDKLGGLRCNIEMGDNLVPWRYGISIEVDGEQVWCGPITNIARPTRDGAGSDYVTVTAQDKMIWTQKRTATSDIQFTNSDAGTVFQYGVEDAMFFDNLPGLYCPPFDTGYTMTREVLALNFEYWYDTLQDLANSAVDYFMIGGKLAVQNQDITSGFPKGWLVVDDDGVIRQLAPTPDTYGRYFFGLFTDEAWVARPGWNMDGMAQANDVFVPGTDSGEAGFRRYWTHSDVNILDGLLTYVDVNSLYRPQADSIITNDAVFQERADTIWELRHSAPIVISGGVLGPEAPVSRDSLFPGSIWAMDLAEHGLSQLLTVQRLKRVDVNVAKSEEGLTETISPTLIPLGTDESEGG